ncbi:HK97 family phage prohead protease [Taklimakanibacter deserti]|uniref:HK97 family phage prohead protease n=1 Tax=Taklimakanibacter deserti TaxID=2267839 RepID=UPI000E65E6CC
MNRLELKAASVRGLFDYPCEIKLAADDTAGVIEGYGSVFNLLDRGGDIILPGAFKKTLADWRKRKENPPMLWQHDSYEVIGHWTELSEDSKGLKVKGELFIEDVPQAKVAHALMRKGQVKGLSIGYITKEVEIDRQTGARKLKTVELWEISPVTFPMMPEARLSAVKSEFDAPAWEQAFRDGGLSNREAKLATSIARKTWLQRDVGESEPPHRDGARDVLMALRKLSETVRA